MPAPPVALFDLDGTLVDTLPDLIDVLGELFARLGLPHVTLDEGRHYISHGIKPLIERALTAHGKPPAPEVLDGHFRDYVAAYEARIAKLSRPFEGVEAACDALAAEGFALAVCTNKLTALSNRLLGELGLAHRFAAVAGNDTFPVRKPDPGHVLGTIAAAGGDPARAIMIGDSIVDVAAARNAGIPVVAVSFGYSDRPAAELGADRVIDHFRELPAAVGALVPARRG